jgi:hypothetical protein
MLVFCTLQSIKADAKSVDNLGVPVIYVTKLDITDEALNLVYEIRNDSEEDVWIFAGIDSLGMWINRLGMHADVFMDEDNQTLVLRGCWNLPLIGNFDPSPYGRYVRLHAGEKQTETVFLKIPVHFSSLTMNPRFTKRTKLQGQYPEYARRLVIELGYYTGNFPEKIIKILPPPENILPEEPPIPYSTNTSSRWRKRHSSFCQYNFNSINERLISREEEVLIPELYAFTEFTNKEN